MSSDAQPIDLASVTVSQYSRVTNKAPSRKPITLGEFGRTIHDEIYKEQVAMIRNAESPEDAKSAKLKLPAVQLSGRVIRGNRKQAMQEGRFEHSRCVQIDVDEVGLCGMTPEEARDALGSDPHVITAFVGPSGNGAKALFRIPGCVTEDEHNAACRAVWAYIRRTLKIEPDESTCDSARLCFISSDPDCRWNSEAVEFPLPPPDEAIRGATNRVPEALVHCDATEDTETILERLRTKNKLVPQLLDGMWEGHGFPSQSEADFSLACSICEETPDHDQQEELFTESDLYRNDRKMKGALNKARQRVAEQRSAVLAMLPAGEHSLAIHDSQWADIERRVTNAGNGYKEWVFAPELKGLLPQILTTGAVWRFFDGKRWERIEGSDRFLPVALQLLARFGHNTGRRAHDLVSHIGASCQTTQTWRGAYAFDSEGAVLLNLSNGILRVTRGGTELLPHDWSQGFTLTIPTPWEPEAECPAFIATLSASVPDPDDRELFRLFAGSILEPSARLEAGLAAFGPSGTGKSTLVHSGIAEALGGANAGTVSRVSLKQLCDPKSYSLPGLEYSMVNLITEGDALEVEESANFKSIISGEPIECREIYGKPRVIVTTAKLLLATNALPRFRNGTDAEGRRLRLLNFNQVPATPDPDLKHRIHAEGPGLLRWMAGALQDVLGLRDMPRGGESAKRVADRFNVSNDSLGCFVKQECILDPAAFTGKEELLGAFNQFAEDHGFSGNNAVWFYRKLMERYPDLATKKRAGIRGIAGIALLNEPPGRVEL